jgi:hypothetical protein
LTNKLRDSGRIFLLLRESLVFGRSRKSLFIGKECADLFALNLAKNTIRAWKAKADESMTAAVQAIYVAEPFFSECWCSILSNLARPFQYQPQILPSSAMTVSRRKPRVSF